MDQVVIYLKNQIPSPPMKPAEISRFDKGERLETSARVVRSMSSAT